MQPRLALTVIAFLLAGGVGLYLVQQGQHRRERQTADAVGAAIGAASEVLGRARAMKVDDLSLWPEVEAAARHAVSLAETGDADQGTRARAEGLLAEVASAREQARAAHERALEDDRILEALADEPELSAMRVLFKGHGIDLGDPTGAAAAISERAISREIVAALDRARFDASVIDGILGAKSGVNNGVVKVSFPREGSMHGTSIGGTMGLSSWAAFSGNDDLASMDGDFIMTAAEVQPVLRAMRRAGIHVVALHNHMTGEQPHFYFTHYWATGPVEKLAQDFKAVLDVQARLRSTSARSAGQQMVFDFDAVPAGEPNHHWNIEGTE